MKQVAYIYFAGFQRDEAEVMTEVLSDAVTLVIDHQTRIMVTKLQQVNTLLIS